MMTKAKNTAVILTHALLYVFFVAPNPLSILFIDKLTIVVCAVLEQTMFNEYDTLGRTEGATTFWPCEAIARIEVKQSVVAAPTDRTEIMLFHSDNGK